MPCVYDLWQVIIHLLEILKEY